jgi:hypothetical protein
MPPLRSQEPEAIRSLRRTLSPEFEVRVAIGEDTTEITGSIGVTESRSEQGNNA